MKSFLAILILLVATTSYCLDIPFTVDIGSAVSSVNYVVSMGVPFPIGTFKDMSSARVMKGNTIVSSQRRSLVNWPDGSVKSMMVSITPDPASSGTGYDTSYKIRVGGQAGLSDPSPTNAIVVTYPSGHILVNTGVAKFLLNTDHYTVFDQVSVNVNGDGTTYVDQMTTGGDVIFHDAVSNHTFNTVNFTAANGYVISIVDAGPLKTTVKVNTRARGASGVLTSHGDADLLSLEVWMTFYANSGRVDFKNVWIDNTSTQTLEFYPPNRFTLDNYYVSLPLINTSRTYAFGSDTVANTTYTGTLSQSFSFTQDAIKTAEDRIGSFIYQFKYTSSDTNHPVDVIGSPTEYLVNPVGNVWALSPDQSSGRALGWIDLADGTSGVSATIKNFWQKFPAGFTALSSGGLNINLQPSTSANIYRVGWPGEAMSDDFQIDFHQGTDVAASKAKGTLFDTTPLIRPPAQWYVDSGVFGPISKPTVLSAPYEANIEKQFQCSAKNTGCNKYPTLWGREDFGDYQLNSGFNTRADGSKFVAARGMNHYEDAHAWIIQYARKADEAGARKFFDFGAPYATNYYNQVVMHIPNSWEERASSVPGMIHHHGWNNSIELGHVVPGGLAELYYLTGDPRAFEVVKEMGDWLAEGVRQGYFRIAPEFTGDTLGGEEYERAQAWPLYTALRTYEVTGIQKYWDATTVLMQYVVNWWKMPNQHIQAFDARVASTDMTIGSNIMSITPDGSIQDTHDIQVGMLITNNDNWDGVNGIPTGTTVVSIESPSHITMSAAATQTQMNRITAFLQVINTNLPICPQALFCEDTDWTQGNGYFLTTMKVDNSATLPASPKKYLKSDSSTWQAANRFPIAWMAAFLNTDVILYYEQLKKRGGTYTAQIDHGHGPATVSVDADTIREMLIQTTNVQVNHNYASTSYQSLIPWLNNSRYNQWVYSISVEKGIDSSDGDSQMPFVLSYVSNFTQAELAASTNSTRWVSQWPALQTKYRAIAYNGYHPMFEPQYFSPFTGYNGAAPLWNSPYAVAMMLNRSADTTSPTVDAFSLPSTANTLAVPIPSYSFIGSDDVGITGYLIAVDNNSQPTPDDSRWVYPQPTTAPVPSQGSHTLYPWVKDNAGNVSSVYASPQTVSVTDLTPPSLYSGSPNGAAYPSGTTSVTVSLFTNETATCKYNTVGGLPYSDLGNTTFGYNAPANSNGYHQSTISGQTDGTNIHLYVRCMDAYGNANTSDYTVIHWSVVGTVTTSPVNRVIGNFKGNLQ